ncbi:MAG: hypothetical protein PF513_07705 [Tenericutes bacterium]|nr:hypothetical protein [Mycoplasmatota bacterium]
MSLISLSITYLIFSLYEKNHYDEEEMLSHGKVRNLSMNVSLFFSFILLYYVTSSIINYLYQSYLIDLPSNIEGLHNINIMQATFFLFSIDFIILSTIMFFIIRKSINRFLGKGSVYKLLTLYIYSALFIGSIRYLWRLLNPMITQYFVGRNGIEYLYKLSNIIGYIEASFMIYPLIIIILIIYHLFKTGISYISHLIAYAILPPIAILIAILSVTYESHFFLIVSAIINIAAYIALYLFFIKHTQIINKKDPNSDYI